MNRSLNPCLLLVLILSIESNSPAQTAPIQINTKMPPPRWAVLERELLAANVPACQEFFKRYYDERGYLQCFVRWGANDGPDDAFENFNRWPELHALGADDSIKEMYLKGHEGMLKQYTEAKTVEVPIARQGMYYKEFCVQSDWMHLGEGLQLFNRMGLSVAADPKYQERARRFAGFYMNEDPEAQNYDPVHKIIKSMENGSRGPMLRKATPIDWVGDPFDVAGFDAVHGESTFAQFLAHYSEYTDVVGDNCLNLVATTLPLDAYMIAHEAKYKAWLLEYMDAWLDRMKQNKGIIPSYVDLNGVVGGPEGKWWGNAYGWGFSPVNPVNGRRENRHRIPRALIGFNNALLISGDQKYVDAWRNMINAVNSNGKPGPNGQMQYPTMYNEQGWYGWQNSPWNIGAVEIWYWSMKPDDLGRIAQNPWVSYLQGQNQAYPETALQRDLQSIQQKLVAMRKDNTPPEKRLADNMLNYNPATTASLVQLMLGGLPPGADGSLLNARLRYFDPAKKRAGIPEDVAALVSDMTDGSTTLTLVNLNPTEPRTVIVQGGAYGEHQISTIQIGEKTTPINASTFSVQLAAGAGEKVVISHKRYANPPSWKQPWDAVQN